MDEEDHKLMAEIIKEHKKMLEDEFIPNEEIEPIQSITLTGTEEWINKQIKKLGENNG